MKPVLGSISVLNMEYAELKRNELIELHMHCIVQQWDASECPALTHLVMGGGCLRMEVNS